MSKRKHNHILIIEDNPAIATSLQIGLEREGFQVHWIDNGEDGITFALKNQPDLIILDIRLPDGSGFDFCQRMRSLKITQPILILTVQNSEMDKVLGLEIGADDYITKPFGMRELLSRIRALLRRAYGEFASTSSNLLYIKDIVVDLSQGQASLNNTPLNLTPTEYRLLVYLAQHANQALGRTQILEAVWGYGGSAIDEKGVNVHIRRLREKIETDPSKPEIILTIPGIGYRLDN